MTTKQGKLTQQEIVAAVQQKKNDLQSLAQKIGELDMEKEEHKLVIDTMEPLDPKRKCFRLVGGVLVERTVEEVLPALKMNAEGINNIIKQFGETYKKLDEEFTEFQKQHNVQIRPANQA